MQFSGNVRSPCAQLSLPHISRMFTDHFKGMTISRDSMASKEGEKLGGYATVQKVVMRT